LLARLRAGSADDVVTATLLAVDPSRWLLAPAMNERMWGSPATVENVRVLRERGARLVGPATGEMAERSHTGPGRMSEPPEIDDALDGARAVVMAAAVSDQRPAQAAPQKVKKKEGEEVLRLVRTPDILAGLGARYAAGARRPVLVGFAAETEKVEEHAREKLE